MILKNHFRYFTLYKVKFLKHLNIDEFIKNEKNNVDEYDIIIDDTNFSIERTNILHSINDYSKLLYSGQTLFLTYNLYSYIIEASYCDNKLISISCKNKFDNGSILYKIFLYSNLVMEFTMRNRKVHNSNGPAKKVYKILFNLFARELKNEQAYYINGHQISEQLFLQKMETMYNLSKSTVLELNEQDFRVYSTIIKERFPEKIDDLNQITVMRSLIREDCQD